VPILNKDHWFTKIAHSTLNCYTKRKSTERLWAFIVSTVITTVISAVLSFILPGWLVLIGLAIWGMVRLISFKDNASTVLSIRDIGKTLGVWQDDTDGLIKGQIIYGVALWVVIKFIGFLINH
jgi:hypothetical protein